MAAKVITVFNQKGGCAKTNTAMQIAGTMGMNGMKVIVIDMDPQNTAAFWFHQATPENPFPADVLSMSMLEENFIEKLPPYVEKYDVIVIDCPPAINSRVPWAAVNICDLAIIPVIPVMDNVWASQKAETLVIEAQAHRAANNAGTLKAAYLLSVVRRGNIFDTCLEALRKKTSLPILTSRLGMFNSFNESQLYGCVVRAFGKSTAANQVDALVKEVNELLETK